MNKQDWEFLKEEAQDFIDNINLTDMPDIDYAMFGASLAILDHVGCICNITSNSCDIELQKHIDDELSGAKKYLKMYLELKDADYLQMSYDETTHALKFIRQFLESAEKEQYMLQHDQILSQIKQQGMKI